MAGPAIAHALDQLAELAMSTAELGAFRAGVLDALDRVIGFDKASVHAFRAGSGPETCARGYERPAAFDELPRFMAELAPHEIAAASAGRPIVDLEALPARRRDQLALYQHLLRPERVAVYATAMWRADDGVGGVTLARTGRGARFTARETDALTTLLPTLRLGDALVTLRQRDAAAPSLEAWAQSAGLGAREREVAALVVRGLTNGEVAALLRVSRNTVRNQLAAVFRKAEVTTRAELVFAATTFEPPARPPAERPRWLEFVR